MAAEYGSQRASLGCGSLILIALIVIIFSNRGTGDLENEIRDLKKEVNDLRTVVLVQTDEIKQLERKLDRLPVAPKANEK